MSLELDIQNPSDLSGLPATADFERWARATWLDENDAGVVVRVVSVEESRQLNHDFRGKDYATNVLSFPYDPPPFNFDDLDDETDADNMDYLGDLVICQAVVEQEAKEQGKLPSHHWAHLVVHGLLHLQGFDHVSDVEAEIMEARETDILHRLGVPNPYEPYEPT